MLKCIGGKNPLRAARNITLKTFFCFFTFYSMGLEAEIEHFYIYTLLKLI